MRWALLSVRLLISVVGIFAALLIGLTVFPFVNGGLNIEMPSEDQIKWELQDDVISAQADIRIYNGGYFVIEDFRIWVNLTDKDGMFLSESSSPAMDLNTKEWTTITLPFILDLSKLSDDERMDVVLNGTEVMFNIGLDAYLGLRTIHVNIETGGDQTMNIPPMVSDLNIGVDQVSLEQDASGYSMVVPYSFSAADILTGKTLNMVSQMSNLSGPLGQARTSILMQSENSGQLRYSITNATAQHLLTEPDKLLFSTFIDLGGVSFEKDVRYDWSPFIRNFGIDDVKVASGTSYSSLVVSYHFQALAPLVGQSVRVNCTVTNINGTISQGTDQFVVYNNNQRNMVMDIAQSTMTKLVGMDEEWTISMTYLVDEIEMTIHTTYHWNGNTLGVVQ